jgi:DNA-binding response OmpR family regulator
VSDPDPPQGAPEDQEVRLLLVEDDAYVASALRRVLNARGLETDIARCLAEARSRLRELDYHAMILDLGLGVEDGLSLLEDRREPRVPATVVLSGFVDVPTLARARRAGAAEVLEKPVRADELVERVHAVAGLARTRPGLAPVRKRTA